jgi:hypothetical protein
MNLRICALYTCKPDLYNGATHVPQVKKMWIKKMKDARAGGIKGELIAVGLVFEWDFQGLVGILRFFLHNVIVPW